MTDPNITREEVEQLMCILRFRANSINMNYLQHPIADDLRAAADRLIALRDELDRVTARVAELEAALRVARRTMIEGGGGGVCCTVWVPPDVHPHETLVDHIDLCLKPRASLRTDKGDG